VSRQSATIGLPGNIEDILPLNADHSDMCKFDPNNKDDESNYEVVSEAVTELYEQALNQNNEVLANLPNAPKHEPACSAPSIDVGQGT
jgi:hypothetical protein